jgi:uncharacterized protein
MLIEETIEFVKRELENAESGHDWWHTQRVYNLSKAIGKEENVDLEIVELGALLHDVADSKFHNGDHTVGPRKAKEFLSGKISEDKIEHVIKIIENISFSSEQVFKSKELDVIQDADRLDAIGTMGIARCFTYTGHTNREIHNPEIKPKLNMSKEEYKKNKGTGINHFYEKLLLLKDKMNTETGKKMAIKRHEFMEVYLKEFYKEWEGEI